MNYQIIKDESLLRDFIQWLPELEPHEKYYMCLFARSKYCKTVTHISSDKAQLKRFVTDKKRMYEKIKQLEVEVGAYRQKDIGIPEEALALYITPNPRNMFKASINTMVKLAHAIRDENVMMSPHQEALSEVQKAKSRTCYIDFDIDLDSQMQAMEIGVAMTKIKAYVNKEAVTYLKTRGGMHVLIDPTKVSKEYIKSFYQGLKSIAGVDQTGDQMIPVPGCTQGMFIPHFLNLNNGNND